MSASKKPTLKKFKQIAEKWAGVKYRIADELHVNRCTIDVWCDNDPEFAEVIQDYRRKNVDEYAQVARVLALGIPEVDPVTKKITGWKVPPDANMLKFLLSSQQGRREGFGETLDVTSNGKSVATAIQVEVIDSRAQVEVKPDEDNQ